MSNEGFIMKYRCKDARELKRNHTAAFLVLDTIAENANRDPDDDLPLGAAIITAEACGITKKQFPNALKFLEEKQWIEILHRGRKDKNSKLIGESKENQHGRSRRIKGRINGTVVKLLDSTIYDINLSIEENQKETQRRINTGEKGAQTINKETNKLKEQQQPQTPSFADSTNQRPNFVAVVAFDKENLEKNGCAIKPKTTSDNLCYEKLIKLKLSPAEIETILNRFDQNAIIHAINFVSRPEFALKTTMVQALYWAAETLPELPATRALPAAAAIDLADPELEEQRGEEFNQIRKSFWEIIRSKALTFEKIGREVKVGQEKLALNDKNYDAKLKKLLEKYNLSKCGVA